MVQPPRIPRPARVGSERPHRSALFEIFLYPPSISHRPRATARRTRSFRWRWLSSQSLATRPAPKSATPISRKLASARKPSSACSTILQTIRAPLGNALRKCGLPTRSQFAEQSLRPQMRFHIGNIRHDVRHKMNRFKNACTRNLELQSATLAHGAERAEIRPAQTAPEWNNVHLSVEMSQVQAAHHSATQRS